MHTSCIKLIHMIFGSLKFFKSLARTFLMDHCVLSNSFRSLNNIVKFSPQTHKFAKAFNLSAPCAFDKGSLIHNISSPARF